ncbi:MAG TPA: hypothetical protein VEQ86_10330, partial [Xanthobacteraceae bacterium]|nr:hypothetical protein [Xanthobacteraceae bacterium]
MPIFFLLSVRQRGLEAAQRLLAALAHACAACSFIIISLLPVTATPTAAAPLPRAALIVDEPNPSGA